MRRLLLLVCVLLCTGCSALPAEERAFAVALGISREGAVWEASVRIPTYQSGGGYRTVRARGASMQEALAGLDAASPMHLHLGQLRLVVCGLELAQSEDFRDRLEELAQQRDFRMQAALCVTQDAPSALLDKLEPPTGSRLSKSVEAMLESLGEQGVIPRTDMAEALRMGVRESPLYVGAELTEPDAAAQGGSDVRYAGAYAGNARGTVKGRLTAQEMQLLSLMKGQLREGLIVLPGGSVRLLEARSEVTLTQGIPRCRIRVRYASSTLDAADVPDAIRDACVGVLGRLRAAGCDALGLARRQIRHCPDMTAWHALDWQTLYPMLSWDVQVEAGGAI